MRNLDFDFDFIVPLGKRAKRRRSASNPWIRKGASSSGRRSKEFRECSHCKATETPQWREGPMGPSTLCNACGVRYRTGRLFPEYRPANSPTFVPNLHSNSHRKVVEMRRKGVGEAAAAMAAGEDSVKRGAEEENEEAKHQNAK